MSARLEGNYIEILKNLKEKIRQARVKAVLTVNTQLLEVYWEIGDVILKQQTIEGWGTKVIERLAKDLKQEFPDMKGLSIRSIRYMRALAEAYPDFPIVQQPAAQLSKLSKEKDFLAKVTWSHHQTILDRCENINERIFYIAKSIENGWSRNVLKRQIESNLFKRQGAAITNFSLTLPDASSDLAQETFKSPYIFDFLSMQEKVQERDLENALINDIKEFLLELGKGFAFVGNQYNLNVEGDDFFLDLLFYNTQLHCYVVFELKVGDFKPEFAGKLNFYINAVNAKIKNPLDNPTIGILLCKTPKATLVEYSLQGLDKPLGVADYELSSYLPEDLINNLPTKKELTEEIEKEIALHQTPLSKKMEKLKVMISNLTEEEVKLERSSDIVLQFIEEIFHPLHKRVIHFAKEILSHFRDYDSVFMINSTGRTQWLEFKKLVEETANGYLLRIEYRFKGFKKAGLKTFDCWTEIEVKLERYKYKFTLSQKNEVLFEGLYHKLPTDKQIDTIAEKVVENIIDQTQEHLKRLGM